VPADRAAGTAAAVRNAKGYDGRLVRELDVFAADRAAVGRDTAVERLRDLNGEATAAVSEVWRGELAPAAALRDAATLALTTGPVERDNLRVRSLCGLACRLPNCALRPESCLGERE
jgi:hypothetical protein